MCIDMKNNKLHIGTTGISTDFLTESELPECARLNQLTEEEARREANNYTKESEDRALAEALTASAKESAGGATTSGNSKGKFLRCCLLYKFSQI